MENNDQPQDLDAWKAKYGHLFEQPAQSLRMKGVVVNPAVRGLVAKWARDFSNELAWEMENIAEIEKIRLTDKNSKA